MTTESENSPPRNSLAVRVFKVIAVLIALLITLLVFVVVHENWSGAREWARVEARLIEAGVELDPKKMIGEAPPAGENFGAHPLLISLSQFETDEEGEIVYDDPETVEQIQKLAIPSDVGRQVSLASWQSRERLNLPYIAEQLKLPGQSVEDVLAWFAQHDEVMAELDRAAQRPHSFYPFTMGETFIDQVSMAMPYASDFMNLAKFYGLRASAELEAGNEEEARKALHTLMQIGELASTQPNLVSHLVGVACHQISLSVIWYGMDRNLLSVESLEWIRGRLQGEPEAILASVERAVNFELCVFIIGGMDYLKAVNSGEAAATLDGVVGDGSGGKVVFSLLPNGIWDHNKAFAAEWIFETGLDPLSRGEMADEGKETELVDELRLGNFPAPRRFMAGIMVPAISGVSKRTFEAAVVTELADLSCALELYRKRNGQYPESLGSLVSEYIERIPVDRFSPSGDPIRYRREGDRYTLFSVGQNRKDDGGAVALKKHSSNRVDRKRGDLVWGFEAFEDLPEEE
jgi:hypothetical protein